MGAAVLTIGLITYGAWVRVSGAGLGCPDWPLCEGVIIPELEGATAIEFGHRVYAGVTMLATAVAAWYAFRARTLEPLTNRLLLWALAAIVAQAGRPGVVTIATNMAGRGTDIVLGGNPEAELGNGDAEREAVMSAWQ